MNLNQLCCANRMVLFARSVTGVSKTILPCEVSLPTSDIFISYSRTDRSFAKHLARCLEEEGFSVWWDAALHAGESFDEVIEAQLRAARVVVVLWSKRSVASRWVRAEATLADRMNKLAPVLIEDCDRPIIFELIHSTDLIEWSGELDDPTWRGFVEDLKHARDRHSEAKIEARPKAAPRSFGGKPAPSASKYAPAPVPAPAPAASIEAPAPVLEKPREKKTHLVAEETRTGHYAKPEPAVDLLGADFHCLELVQGSAVLKRHVVSPAGLRIGRTAPADVILPDPAVSRAHCIVELADDRLRVTDLRSTNGTFIDGTRVEGSAFLEVGATLRIGSASLRHAVRGPTDD
jgi:hypothetical protein